ncbi:DUF4434 domain-containing protein [bacterium]|nr:DUF4434 domain-containing protein [bacterium]
MQRRGFMNRLGAFAASAALVEQLQGGTSGCGTAKPIEGSWFEFQHHSAAEGAPWNPALAAFSAGQWAAKVQEIAGFGIRDLVLLDTAIDGRSFYPSGLLPRHELGCDDPLEAVLAAADQCGVRFFVSNGFYGDWMQAELLMQDKAVRGLRFKAMAEIAGKYAHHPSFFGWYYPNETGIEGHFADIFIDYVNSSTAEAHSLTPQAKTLIAPYGTRHVSADDLYVRQLETLDVDYVAYQDEVGVEKTKVEESAGFFENLYKVHHKAGRAALWADVEVFRFEGKVYHSALLPAPPERVKAQLEAVSPYVEKILIYQYLGLLNRPGSEVFAGPPESAALYSALKPAK